jgi:hypothetical protein
MPATTKQRGVAGREIRLRREGKVTKEANRHEATRPMGSMKMENLRKYAQSTKKEIAKLERRFSETGQQKHAVRVQRAKNQKIREDNE